MSEETLGVTVCLLGHEYRFSCPASEKEQLLETARFLDEKMQEIRKVSNKIPSFQDVAVMAAMNCSYELLQQQRQSSDAMVLINCHVKEILQKADAVLDETP